MTDLLSQLNPEQARAVEPAAQRDFHLAHGFGVDAAAESFEQAHDRERRVGLERVVDRVRVVAKCGVKTCVGPTDDGRVIDVTRCAHGGCDCLDRRTSEFTHSSRIYDVRGRWYDRGLSR